MNRTGIYVALLVLMAPLWLSIATEALEKGEGRGSERAGESGQRGPGRFDTDGDGRISAEEFPGSEDQFARFDQNGDGFIDREERPQRGQGRRGEEGSRGRGGKGNIDADGDGRVSMEEFPGSDERFSELDSDGDGFISEDERPRQRAPRREEDHG